MAATFLRGLLTLSLTSALKQEMADGLTVIAEDVDGPVLRRLREPGRLSTAEAPLAAKAARLLAK
eukprot:CAMPEP_0178583506 /NCGR_PEP_ID=MMETSP0697-20121206/24294_1 /TAXON_ID=265572 /ORGANISM="Extubocellulus spinifer, Strain CCMP396" /LENGTH=64 /DNA_ID=CAMNT_0020219309 /DNA_START=501 /DNA_END=693 /DNA_ORIENTATION=-